MKKIIPFILFSLSLTLTSCQYFTRKYGGTQTIHLPKGEKLLMATWKGANIFTLTEPMDSDYVPKVKHFKESSVLGVFQSEIIFVESK